MKDSVRLERLKKLKYMIDNHAKLFKTVKFNIGDWVDNKLLDPQRSDHDTRQKVRDLDPVARCKMIREGSCKTAACVLGSAALYEPFNKQGLTIDPYGTPVFDGEEDFDAGAAFFGISSDESWFLFSPDEYRENRKTLAKVLNPKNPPENKKVTTEEVSVRIQALINHYTYNKVPLLNGGW